MEGYPFNSFPIGSRVIYVAFGDSLCDIKNRTLPPGLLILGSSTQSKTRLLYFSLVYFSFHVPATGLSFFMSSITEALQQSGYLIYQGSSCLVVYCNLAA